MKIDWGSAKLRRRAEEHIFSTNKWGRPVFEIIYRIAPSCLGPSDLNGFEASTIYIRNTSERQEADVVRYDVVFFARYSVVLHVYKHQIIVEHHVDADADTLVDDVFQLALSEAVRPRQGYVLHASSVLLDNQGIVLIGNSGVGKSTTCLSLVLGGARLAGDDASLVLPTGTGYDLVPMAAEISVRLDALPLFKKSELLSFNCKGGKNFWQEAPMPEDNGRLRVVALLRANGDYRTVITRMSSAQFFEEFKNHPPLHGFHKEEFCSLLTDMNDNEVVFVKVQLGVSPQATVDAFSECLAQPHKDKWKAINCSHIPNLSEAQSAVARAWNGKGGIGDILPLLVYPVDSIKKSAMQILGSDPLCNLEPLPWEDYDSLWSPAEISLFNIDWVPIRDIQLGAERLVELADSRNIDQWIEKWLNIAPLLYPFLRQAALHKKRKILDGIDKAWQKYIHHTYPPQLMIYLNDNCQMKCPYCYVIENVKSSRMCLKRDDIAVILDWAGKESIKAIGLTGGEPTLYPDFGYLTERLVQGGFFFYFSSNFLFPVNCRSYVKRASSLEIHFSDPSDYTLSQLATFESNLAWLVQENVPKIFRYNLCSDAHADWDWVAKRVNSFSDGDFTFAVPFPSHGRSNKYIDRQSQEDFAQVIVDFVERMKLHGLSPRAAKPYPLCSFTEEQAKRLLAVKALAGVCEIGASGCTRNLVVGPDLDVYPCVALNLSPGKLTSFSSLQQLQNCMRPLVSGHLGAVDYQRCRQCSLREWKICLGGCLAYY